MRILGIETSCDETGAAVVEDGKTIVSNVVASSEKVHKKYGGIVPEQAARKQLEYIIPVLQEALLPLGYQRTTVPPTIDALAVTVGPGLIGSLLVGVETAKTLSYVWRKPLIPVNHLLGHVYSAWLTDNRPKLPAISLVVSGGHTLLIHLRGHSDYTVLGQTRDDAAGEAFDKIARLLGFDYPGGPLLARAATTGNPKAFSFPRPMLKSEDFDFSFSGLKTSVLRKIYPQNSKKDTTCPNLKDKKVVADIAASVQEAIVEVLVKKTMRAVEEYKPRSIIIGGGVAANARLRERFKAQGSRSKVNVHIPPPHLCTDNGAVVAAAAFYNCRPLPWRKLAVDPSLRLQAFPRHG